MGKPYASLSQRRKQQIIDGVTSYRRKKKDRAIEYKGGQCRVCGYNRCRSALHFHHLNPDEKDFVVSQAGAWSWERTRRELDKCILLCGNCHAEVHEGLVDLQEILTPEEVERAQAEAQEPPRIFKFFKPKTKPIPG